MKKLLLSAALAGAALTAGANNIQVTGVSLSGQNSAANYSLINFSVSWDNSWRTTNNESNYDGAWVFAKFRKAGTSVWKHATLNYAAPGTAAASGHTQPSGSILQTPADGKGAWMYRDAAGVGNVAFNGAAVRWNYGADSVQDNDSVEMRVYAVEMVYVTEGQFYLGTAGTETSGFRTGTTTNPYLVTSETSSISIGAAGTNLNYTAGGGGDGTGTLAASFPKGFNDFWIMKHELSEQGYVDFLNTLDATRAATRNTGYLGSAYAFASATPERAAANTGIEDHLAFLDWAALRPFTELEYEKACRGFNILPIPDEYAWGNTTLGNAATVNNPGAVNETPTSGNAVYRANGGFGVCISLCRAIRSGAFANDTTTTRTQTGATYYGAMEMSGNVYEFVVSAGSSDGRLFTGTHGDGMLSATGTANAATWNAAGMGIRGSGFNTVSTGSLRTSDRSSAVYTALARGTDFGVRGARTAE